MIFHIARVKTLFTLHVYSPLPHALFVVRLFHYLSFEWDLKQVERVFGLAAAVTRLGLDCVGPVLQVCVGLPLFIY